MSSTPFVKIFGRPPMRPLKKHMITVHGCVAKLEPLLSESFQGNWDRVASLREEIGRLEHLADLKKREVFIHLPRGLFTPVPRTDLLELVSRQDYLANQAKDVAGLIFGRKMITPEPLQEDMMNLLKRSIDSSLQAQKAIFELEELLEAGFSANTVRDMEQIIVSLFEMEHDVDNIQASIYQKFYPLEVQNSPVFVMFFYELIKWISNIADRAQNIGDRLQIILAR